MNINKDGIIRRINFDADIGYLQEDNSTRQYLFVIPKVTKLLKLDDRKKLIVGKHIKFHLDDEDRVDELILG